MPIGENLSSIQHSPFHCPGHGITKNMPFQRNLTDIVPCFPANEFLSNSAEICKRVNAVAIYLFEYLTAA